MNIRDMQDNDLDTLFRDAAESADFDFEEKSWDSLVKRIDYSDLIKRIIRGSMTAGLILILAASVLYFKYHDFSSPKTNNRQSPVISQNDLPAQRTNPPAVESEHITTDKYKNPPLLSKSGVTGKPFNEHSAVNPVEKQENSGHRHFAERNTGTFTPQLKVSDRKSGNGLPGHKNFRSLKLAGLMKSPVPTFQAPHKMIAPEIIVQNKKQKRAPVSLIAGLTIGPEFSGVKINESGSGMIEGLSLTLVGSRFSVRTGIYHVKKNYAVKHGEYRTPDPGFIHYGKSPDNIAVSCHVIDIPLNVYYTLLNRNENRLFAGTGLSSYLMLTEEYSYMYGTAPNVTERKYMLRNENQHYFSILNLSAGYAKRISGNLLWEIEPYYKLPLTGIAAADVHLMSFGVLVSLDFKIK